MKKSFLDDNRNIAIIVLAVTLIILWCVKGVPNYFQCVTNFFQWLGDILGIGQGELPPHLSDPTVIFR